MFNSCCTLYVVNVVTYGHLLPTVYLFMADIANPDLFVSGCRTWICLDITRIYEEQRQPSSGSAWPACPKTVNRAPIFGVGVSTLYTAVCIRCDSFITCMLCSLEPVASSHPHYSTFTLQTYHHPEYRFGSWPTQMISPSHVHTHTSRSAANKYTQPYTHNCLSEQNITSSH